MDHSILVNIFKTIGYSQEIVGKVIREYGQSTESLLLLEDIGKENKIPRRQFLHGTMYLETNKTKNRGVCSSINQLTMDSTPKKTNSRTTKYGKNKFPQLPK